MSDMPKYGAERITLMVPKHSGHKYRIVRQVFRQEGGTTFYDETMHDWVTWHGAWHHVETLGRFENRDQARDFMLARAKRTDVSSRKRTTDHVR